VGKRENAKWTLQKRDVLHPFGFNWNMKHMGIVYVFIFTIKKGTHVEGGRNVVEDENGNIKIIKIFLAISTDMRALFYRWHKNQQ
jgi:hypothetical protein